MVLLDFLSKLIYAIVGRSIEYIPDYAVIGVNPAKIIKFRNTDGNKS